MNNIVVFIDGKDDLDALIESTHEDGQPMYEKYIRLIRTRLKCKRDEAMELFHYCYILYVDVQNHDRVKYKNDQIVLFDEYIHGMCLETLRERWRKEMEQENV